MIAEIYAANKLTLDFELTSHCNARCPQCSRTNEKDNLKKHEWIPLMSVSINQFKKWFPEDVVKKIKNFHFSGTYGDPGMCKDLLKICQYIMESSYTTKVSINTNAGMRDEDFWFDLGATLMKRGTIIFDVDGIDQEMHNFYRRGVELKKVLANMASAMMTPVNVNVLTVMFKHNEDYIEDIQNMCREIGHVNNFDTVEGNNFQKSSKYDFIDEDGNEQYLEQITRKDREQGLKRITRRVRDHRHRNIINDYDEIECVYAKNNSVKVSSTGSIGPCCYLSTPLQRLSFLQPEKNIPPPVTLNGKTGDKPSPAMQEYIDNWKEFSLNHNTFENIIYSDWYNKTLPNSLNDRAQATFACKKVCGKVCSSKK